MALQEWASRMSVSSLACGGEVISALERKAAATYPKTKKGLRDADFYKGLFIEFRAFKDFFRNKVSHTRVDYDEHAALSAFNHVRAFIQRLAERVREVK